MTRVAAWIAALLPCLAIASAAADEPAPQTVIAAAARKVVKLYGAGGLRGERRLRTAGAGLR